MVTLVAAAVTARLRASARSAFDFQGRAEGAAAVRGNDNPAFRQFITSLLIPDATPDQARSLNELMRIAASARANRLAQLKRRERVLRTSHRCSVGPMSIESQLRSPNTVCLPRVKVSST